jgi:hydrogenase maturation factor
MSERGRMSERDAYGERCQTCGDVAVAMRVLSVQAGSQLAVCAAADGARVDVDTGIVGAVAAGELLLVHAGTALARAAGEGA